MTLAYCALNPRDPLIALPTIHLARQTSYTFCAVVLRVFCRIFAGIVTSAQALIPLVSRKFSQAGFLSISKFPATDRQMAPVFSSINWTRNWVAIVTIFIPI